jgi:hypothetical protein
MFKVAPAGKLTLTAERLNAGKLTTIEDEQDELVVFPAVSTLTTLKL